MPTSAKRPTRGALVFLGLASLLYGSFLWLSTRGIDPLDAEVFYTPVQAVERIGGLTPEQRLVYEGFNLVDFGFVLVYSSLLVTWFRFLRNRAALPRGARPVIGVVPGMFDLGENLAIAMLLRTAELGDVPWLWVAVITTPLKWLSVVGVLGVIVVGELRWRKYMRARRRAARQVRAMRRR